MLNFLFGRVMQFPIHISDLVNYKGFKGSFPVFLDFSYRAKGFLFIVIVSIIIIISSGGGGNVRSGWGGEEEGCFSTYGVIQYL